MHTIFGYTFPPMRVGENCGTVCMLPVLGEILASREVCCDGMRRQIKGTKALNLGGGSVEVSRRSDRAGFS